MASPTIGKAPGHGGQGASRIAVVAHRDESLGGSLDALRRALAGPAHDEPLWFEIAKSKHAPRSVHQAVKGRARLVIARGGDGAVQHVAGALVALDARHVALAIMSAGNADLIATNVGIPGDFDGAPRAALGGHRRRPSPE